MTEDKDIIGIKIPKNAPLVTALKIIRKYTQESYADIKSHILNNDYVFSCKHADDEGLNKILTLYSEFTKAKIKPTLYDEDGEKTTIRLLKNLVFYTIQKKRWINMVRISLPWPKKKI